MLTNEDIKKLQEVLSTKNDLDQFKTEMNRNFSKVVTLEEFDQFKVEIKQDIDGLREMVQSLVVSVDKLVKAVTDLKTEYAAITNQVNRHEKWFQQIAEKLGLKLEY